MNITSNLGNDMNFVITKIYTQYPELSKYFEEIPFKFSDNDSDAIQNKNLLEYYNSLVLLCNKYAVTHRLKIDNPPPEETSNDHIRSSVFHQHISGNNKEEGMNEKDFEEDMSGDDLDVPGSELDDQQESIGSEDEENNYYSLGGDNHNNLEEDNG